MIMKELMERAGTSSFGFANAYLEDGVREINMMIEESVAVADTNLEKDQRYYGMESSSIVGLVKILDVSILDVESDEYKKIPRMIGIDTVDRDSV